ncbi:MAG: hypothetical protein IKU42_01030, partial [Oscillospiraceae bacterium]|nr:hypothetical protein [Oscillospiraceae bacterium]
MKKFFLNKKLMTLVLSLCLCVVIGGIAVFAAFQSGLPGVERIKDAFFEESSSESSSSEEPKQPLEDENSSELDSDIVFEPVSPENQLPEVENVVDGPIVFDFPERMMAITLAAGVDFAKEEGMSISDIEKSIDKALEDAKALSANTIFIETSYGDKVLYYSEGMPQAEVSIDMLKYVADKAKSMDMYVYAVLNVLNFKDGEVTSEKLTQISKNAAALCEYDIDGIMLDAYTLKSDGNAYAEYTKFGSGMGYENYLRSNTEAAVTAAYNGIKKADPSVAVGLAVDAVWANEKTIEGGSDTLADYESFTDGFANTKKFVEEGYADFVAVKSNYSTGNKNAKFINYAEWWNAVVAEKVPLYIFQYATKACTDEKGWNDPSELS